MKIAIKNPLGNHMAHQSAIDIRFFDKCDFGPIQNLFNNSSPFHLSETRSISFDRSCLVLSSEIVVWQKNREILNFGINSGHFRSKSQKKYKNSMKPVRIEDFKHEKPFHTLPEYPGYDVKILSQHGVSDPLKTLAVYYF